MLGVILTGWFLGGLWPFGDRSMAIIDLGSQYLGMYDYIGKVLSGQDGLLYSFNKGAGGGMNSLWTYYLMSPFNLLFAYFNGDRVLQGVHCVYLIKTVVQTLTATHYFKKKGLDSVYNAIFTIGWVLSGYLVMNRLHIMWMDAFILLPLVLLALEEGLNNNKYGRFTIYLTLTIISNYYIGYMVGLFTLVYVLYKYLTRDEGQPFHLVGYIKHCIYSGLLTVWVLLPTAYSILDGLRTIRISNIFHNFKWGNILANIRFMESTMEGYESGAPLVMAGTALFIYVFICLVYTTKKERVAYSVITLIYLLSFSVRAVSRIWTLGQDETWYIYRFAFTYVWFNLVFVVNNKQYLGMQISRKLKYGVSLALLVTSVPLTIHESFSLKFIGFIIVFMSLGYVVAIMSRTDMRKWMMLLIVVLEVGTMSAYGYRVSGGRGITEQQEVVEQQVGVSHELKEQKELKSRIYYGNNEGNYNNGFTIGESILTHTSSTINETLRDYTGQMGLSSEYSKMGALGMTGLGASLLNVEYIDTTLNDGDTNYLNDEQQFEKLSDTLYHNKIRLGFGYTISEIIDIPEQELGLNIMTQTLFGKDYLTELVTQPTDSYNIEVLDGLFKVIDNKKEAWVTYKKPDNANYVYTRREEEIPKEGDEDESTESKVDKTDYKTKTSNLGAYLDHLDEEIETVTYTIKGESPIVYTEAELPVFYRLEGTNLEEDITQYYETNSQFELSETQGNSSISGTINNQYNQLYLQLSIPYEEGWSALVNGREVEVYNSMNSLALPIPGGLSTIEMRYTTPYLGLGLIISLSALCLILLEGYLYKKHKSKQS